MTIFRLLVTPVTPHTESRTKPPPGDKIARTEIHPGTDTASGRSLRATLDWVLHLVLFAFCSSFCCFLFVFLFLFVSLV